MRKWYEDLYRRSLVDMHISADDERFLGQFDPWDYYENLKLAHVNAAMLYVQAHTGYCYYPTKSGEMHPAFVGKEDQMRKLFDLCREGGIRTVAYYSLLFNTIEEKKHPEWALVNGTGKDFDTSSYQRGSRYGHLCPNNPDYLDFVKTQISEIAGYFKTDGIFYDMPYWSGICHCKYCREKWKTFSGKDEMPLDALDAPVGSPEWLEFQRARRLWLKEFVGEVTGYTKKVMPDVSVEFNCAYSANGDWKQALTEEIVGFSDYCGGDVYGDLYRQSFVCKYFRAVTKNQPFEYMISRCTPNLSAHTMTKSHTALSQEILLTAAHHGASFVIDAMDPVGTLDKRLYQKIGAAFEAQMPYEKYFKGRPMRNVGVLYSSAGRFDPLSQDLDSRSCSVELVKTLVSENVPTDVVAGGRMPDEKELDTYSLLMAPAIAGLSKEAVEKVVSYVQNGGNLYFSGTGQPEFLKIFFNGEATGCTKTKFTYLAPVREYEDLFGGYSEKYPLAVDQTLPTVKIANKSAKILARLTLPYDLGDDKHRFASIHSNPPGLLTDVPMAATVDFGRGKVFFSSAPIEADPRLQFRHLIRDLCLYCVPVSERDFSSDAPWQVEIVGFDDENELYMSFVDLKITEEHLTLPDFTVKVRCQKDPCAVTDLATGEKIPFTYENGFAVFTVKKLDQFRMIGIKIGG